MLQLSPESETVNWYVEFSATSVSVTTGVTTTSTTEGASVTETVVEPVPASVIISSVAPVESYPPDPTVAITITSSSTFEISGVYKNMMGTSHTWRDNNYVLQTSIVPPEPGTYDKIIQVISPPLQKSPGKPWKYKVDIENDQNVKRTTTTSISSVTESVSVSTASIGTLVVTGTSILGVPIITTASSTGTTTITTVTSKITTSTQTVPDWIQITRRTFTTTEITTINTGTSFENISASLTFTMYVIHDNYDIVKNNILTPLLSGQPEPAE